MKNIHNLQSTAYENAAILLNTSEKAEGLLCITEQKWREYRSQRWKRLECEIYSHTKTAENKNQQGIPCYGGERGEIVYRRVILK